MSAKKESLESHKLTKKVLKDIVDKNTRQLAPHLNGVPLIFYSTSIGNESIELGLRRTRKNGLDFYLGGTYFNGKYERKPTQATLEKVAYELNELRIHPESIKQSFEETKTRLNY